MPRRASAPAAPPPAWTFPEFVLCQASAGSGKTHALSLRFVRLLLAENVPAAVQRDLVNILAITFTRNAAREMKDRILGWLKDAVFEDPAKTRELLAAVGGTPESLRFRAGQAIDRILGGYTDFQVETIDSFMATVFRASAVDLGYPPDFEIVLEPSEAIDYAFSLYLRRVAAGTPEGAEFERILDYLLDIEKGESAFAWDPAAKARARLGEFYLKLSGRPAELVVEDFGKERAELGAMIKGEARRIREVVDRSELERAPRGHAFTKIFPAAEAGRIADLLDFSFKTMPVKRASAKGDAASLETCEAIAADWKRLEKLVLKFGGFYARDFFSPYLRVYRALDETLERAKRSLGTVFLEDVHRKLASYLDTDVVPDVYFRLGDRVAHFLIDEFQDTSPVQWRNFRPLVEESLSRGGSLFLVGDTKQAIYGFRDADFRIMKGLADEAGGEDAEGRAFGPVVVRKETLPENYRSHRAVLDFVKRVFLSEPAKAEDPDDEDSYALWKRLSGLDDFDQEVCGKNKDRPGYVRYIILPKAGETGAGGESGAATDSEESRAGNRGPAPGSESGSAGPDVEPEKIAIQDAVRDLVGRGWTYGDIAVLAYRNEDVVRVSSWLNEIGAPFVPYSSLDVRKRRIVAEVLALLRFLDSPPDDLSFAAFLGGDLFAARLRRDGGPLDPEGIGRFLFANREAECRPLYTAFRAEYPALWDRYFESLFRAVGYYPLYDLITLLYRTLDVFALFPLKESFPGGGNPEGCAEEGALVKLLEAVKNFEGEGRNDLREFVELAGDDETGAAAWNIDVPADLDAVRVMSIHKAKGLGFPVVILLLYGQRWQPPPFFIIEDAGILEDEARVRVVKLNERLSDADEQLADAYKDRKDRDWVNALNTLYVALTRARAELHIIGVKGERDRYPFDLLGEPAPSAPEPPLVVRETSSAEGPAVKRARFRPTFEPKPDPRDVLTTAHIRRGEAVHALLAEIEFVRGPWAAEVRSAVSRLNPAEPDRPLFEAAGEVVARYFDGAPLAAHFKSRPGRSIRNESEVCDAAGRIFRMDRVIIDEDGVTILDYKTGPAPGAEGESEAAAADRAQIRDYARLLSDVFPGRPVRGVLVYIDHPGAWEEAA